LLYNVFNVGRAGQATFKVKKKSGYTLEVYRQQVRQTEPAPGADPNLLEYTINGATDTSLAQVAVNFKLVTPLNEYVNYVVTLFVPQEEGPTNPNLLNLTAWRDALNTGDQLIDFKTGDTVYEVKPDKDNGQTLAWKAQAQSKHSGVMIAAKLDGVSLTANTTWDNTNKILTGTAQFPSGTNQNVYKTLEITVTQGDGLDTRTWTVQLSSYKLKEVLWKGTAQYDGTTRQITRVTARNAAGGTIPSKAITQLPAGKVEWDVEADETWIPESFLITLEDTQTHVSYESGAIFPSTAAITAAKPSAQTNWQTPPDKLLDLTPIPMTSNEVGNRISSPKEFYEKLGGAGGDVSDNYSLACNIDLRGYIDPQTNLPPPSWIGPSGYRGHFYGNGYTIQGLVLSQATGETALFNSLGDGATLENFTLEVSTSDDLKYTTPIGAMAFGGLVANLSDTVTIKSVTVNGTIELYGVDTPTSFIIGGLIGNSGFDSVVTIDRCVSNIDIKVKSALQDNINTSGVGGFMGSVHGQTTITNSYSTGDVEFISNVGSFFLTGCFIGVVGSWNDGYENWTTTIRNSYSSGNLSLDYMNRTTWGNVYSTNVGGLIGGVRRTGTLIVENCAYVGTKLAVERIDATGLVHVGRIFGGTNKSGGKIYNPPGSTFTNNIARLGVIASSNFGVTIDDAGTLSETARNAISDNGPYGPVIHGYGVTANALTQTGTWTTQSADAGGFVGLGWSADIWDFSTVPSLGRPVLRN
jgi:hypothetical protein